MIVLVGLAVDLGGQVHAQQHARAVADQAARTGGQQLDAAVAVRGEGPSPTPTCARRPPRPT
jgi:Flp pilus assembly protein TadG